MLPEDWIEHRREDRETVGWIVPDGDGFRPMDVLGRRVTAEPVEWLEAEEILEGITVVSDEFGSASAVGAGSDRFRLPFPVPEELRPNR